MADIDFQGMLDSMGTVSTESDPIKSIYGIIPYMDSTQMQLKFQLMYFIKKYQLTEWETVFEEIDTQLKNNKSLSFMSSQSLKSLLSAYTQNELVRGVKVQTMNTNEGGTK